MGHNPDAHSVIGVFQGSGRLACDGSSRYTLAEGPRKRLSTKASVPMYRKPSGPWQAHVGVRSAKTVLGKNARTLIDPSGITSLRDRKSTRLNSSHSQISYAVFCLKKKK